MDWKWGTLEEALRTFGATGVMMRLPLFWQLEIPMFETCKRAKSFLFVADRANLPVSEKALEHGHIDCVVTDAQDALSFSSYLHEHAREQPRSWFVIHQGVGHVKNLSELGDTPGAQEVHSSPGMVLLYQCTALRTLRRQEFHIIEGRENEPEVGNLQIGATCTCGQRVVRVPAA